MKKKCRIAKDDYDVDNSGTGAVRGQNNIHYLQNFINVEPLFKSNLKPDKEGMVRVQLDDKHYGYAIIVAVNSGSVADIAFNVPNPILNKRNLA